MKIFFDWASDYCETKTDWKYHQEIISIDISQSELGFASAKVKIFLKDVALIFDKKYAKIGIQNEDTIECIFTGKLVSFPVGFDNSCTILEFISEPNDASEQLSRFIMDRKDEQSKINMHYVEKGKIICDELFFSKKDMNNPTVFLEGDSDVFYWDMSTGKMSLSHINNGGSVSVIDSSEILQNSMKVKLYRDPYKKINLQLSAEWIQHINGIVNVYSMISEKFSNSIISSYSNLKKMFFNVVNSLDRVGYQILKSDIFEINPKNKNNFVTYQMASEKLPITSKDAKDKFHVRLKRFYFDGCLYLGWRYKQKRSETVDIPVLNSSVKYGREKNIYIKLSDIQLPKNYPLWSFFTNYDVNNRIIYEAKVYKCTLFHNSDDFFDEQYWEYVSDVPDALADNTSSTFFNSNRGRNAIKYALQKVVSTIKFSQRSVEISLSIDAKKHIKLSVNDGVVVKDKRFLGGEIRGKVIKTHFEANCDKKLMHLTIACDLNDQLQCDKPKSTDLNQYIDSIAINAPASASVTSSNIIEKVEVYNAADEQHELLLSCNAKSVSDLEKVISQNATKIKVKLHPQNTMRCISNTVQLNEFSV